MELPHDDQIDRELRKSASRKDPTTSKETKQKRTALRTFSTLISSHDEIANKLEKLAGFLLSSESFCPTDSDLKRTEDLFDALFDAHRRHVASIWDILPELCGHDIPSEIVDRFHKNKRPA